MKPAALSSVALARRGLLALSVCCAVPWAAAQDQTHVGAGNAQALQTAQASPLVRSAQRLLQDRAGRIQDPVLRTATLDILRGQGTCILHRRGLAATQAQDAVLKDLMDQGLLNAKDGAAFGPGLRAGVFPPIVDADSDCPHLPQPMSSAPGSVFGGHHSYPGGLMVHEANNELSDIGLLRQYQQVYGSHSLVQGRQVSSVLDVEAAHRQTPRSGDLPIDADVVFAAPIWHDWAKTLVFQWNADGSEFAEFNFGGLGSQDDNGGAGDSRTAAHHILSVAESMARGLSPLMVVTQACAHSAPTLGNEYKVVNWLRAAAIIARIDPLQAGYLSTDRAHHFRLPPLGRLGEVDLNAAGQTNVRVEYVLHNLSDADYPYSIPAVASTEVLLRTLAPEFGYDPREVERYNRDFRNPVFAQLGGERLLILYSVKGLEAVRLELQTLRGRKLI